MEKDDYNRFIKIMQDRDYNSLVSLRLREKPAPRRFTLCTCGDPNCIYGPADTQEAFRRGEISPEMLAEMRREAQADTSSFYEDLIASAASEDEALLKELREKVADYIVTAPEQRFSDIIGNDAAMAQLRDAIRAPVEHKELYEAYDLKMPKGALLSGPPGCGKTMFAKAAACEMAELYGTGVEMISVSGPALQSTFVGVTEQRIISIFKFARQYHKVRGHPLLVFIDEAETILPDRTGRVRRVASWEESQVAAFLAEMDGMEECGAFVLLATNRPEVIDSAVLRDGRCDFKITVAKPNAEAIEGILRKGFSGIFTKEEEDALVFAATESFLDPHKVIIDIHAMIGQAETWLASKNIVLEGKDLTKINNLKQHNFLFEHIVSGAMAASVPTRAKRYAFARDKDKDTLDGVTTSDVVAAVNDLFNENKKLEHAFALREFMESIEEDLKEALA